MELARWVSLESDDRNRKVGCVIVSQDGMIRSLASNQFPRGVNDNEPCRHKRPEKYKWIEHAERNAIYWAARRGVRLDGCKIYIPWYPCMDCARAIIQSGIVELVCVKPDYNDDTWGDDFKRVSILLKEAGVTERFVELEAA